MMNPRETITKVMNIILFGSFGLLLSLDKLNQTAPDAAFLIAFVVPTVAFLPSMFISAWLNLSYLRQKRFVKSRLTTCLAVAGLVFACLSVCGLIISYIQSILR